MIVESLLYLKLFYNGMKYIFEGLLYYDGNCIRMIIRFTLLLYWEVYDIRISL